MLVRLRVLNDDFTLYKYAISSTQQDTTRNKNPNRYFLLWTHSQSQFLLLGFAIQNTST